MVELKDFNNKYFTFDFYENQLSIFWTKKANDISDKMFFFTVKKVAELIRQSKADYIYVDFHYVYTELENINQFQVLRFVIPAFINAKVKRIAIFVGENDVIKSAFISELLEKDKVLINFRAKTFKNNVLAIQWLQKQ